MNNLYMRPGIKALTLAALICSSMSLFAQQNIVVRGSVKDKETGEVIIGANIIEYDADKRIIKGTITDMNGYYVLRVTNPNAIIGFSFIGYKTKEIPLNGQTELNVELEPESFAIDEVVVTAESTADRLTNVAQRDLATSTATVDMSEVTQMGAVSAEEALQGKVSGLDIMSRSGDPGSGSSIVIRGQGSLGNSRPLIVVDGIPQTQVSSRDIDLSSADTEDIGDLVNIAPQDIKSIQILKDAASAAVWGSKGADGVLLIETFRGRKGKTRFDYQGKYTWSLIPPPIPMLNGNEYIMMQLEQWHNARGIYQIPPEISYDPDFVDFYNYTANTDWVEEVTQNGFINEQYFKINGGGDRTRYFASVNNHINRGVTIGTSLKRITSRMNLDYNVSRKIRFAVDFSYSNSYREDNYEFRVYDEIRERNIRTNIREMAYMKAPNMSVWEHDSRGNLTGEYFTPIESYQGLGTDYFNPVAVGNLSTNDVEENRIMNNFTLNYNIAPWVRFMQMVSFQYVNQKRSRFLPHNAIGADWLEPENNEQYELNRADNQIITRSQLFFTPRLDETHSLGGMIMLETDQQDYEYTWSEGGTGPTTDIQDPASNAVIRNIRSGSGITRIVGTMVNVNYKYNDKYMTSLNLRGDASSRFGSNNRWGVFPSASAAWRFSEEPWIESLRFLTEGKLRFSYGHTGKQPGGAYDRHAIFNTLSPGQYIENAIVVPYQVQLANLKWQTLKSSTLGLELYLLERIDITAEIYSKVTEDLLWRNYQIPYASGFDRLRWYNGGKLQNQGWEFMLDVVALRRSNLQLRLNFNVSNNVNTFLEFPENFNREIDMSIGNGKYPRRAQEDLPIGSFYGFRYHGAWPSTEDVVAMNADGSTITDLNGDPVPFTYRGAYKFQGGDAIYEDVNHDGMIDLLDVVYLGDSNPDFIGGMGFNLNWKDIRVFSQFHYRLGHKIVNEVAMRSEGMLDKNNQSNAVLHRWRAEGQNEPGMLPRAYIYHPANNLGSSRYVEDGDFLRLVNLSVNYSLPDELAKRLRIRSLDIGLTMRRIYTFTRYSGQDPEIPQDIEDPFWFGTDKARTPPPKEFTVNIKFGF